MELLQLERECLQVLQSDYQEMPSRIPIWNLEKRFPDVPYSAILATIEKLETLRLVTVYGNEQNKRHKMVMVVPTGKAHLYLEGRLEPVLPGHIEVVVQFDRASAAQICDAIGHLHEGHVELVQAVRTIAEELRRPPEATRSDKIQAACSVLALAASSFPLLQSVMLPVINRLL